MACVISFFLGLSLGAITGFLITAVLVAGGRDDRE